MMNDRPIKILSLFMCGIAVISLVLYAMGRINGIAFWVLAGILMLFAFVALPYVKKHHR